MRNSACLSILLLLAACGDNSDSQPDANVIFDAAALIDAVEGLPDARLVDAMPGSPDAKIADADLPPDAALADAMPNMPDAELPDGDIPDADTPDADTPDADTPDADTPDADTPDADTPDADMPDADTPDAERPDADTPDAAQPGRLMLTEVDYDQPGTDNAEFIEIFNGSDSELSLDNLRLLCVNGNGNTVYCDIDLSAAGSLAAGQYLVIGDQDVLDAVAGNGSTAQTMLLENSIQNGSPDGVVLYDAADDEIVDALSYEGGITAVELPAQGGTSFNLVVGDESQAVDNADGSVCRENNSDTGSDLVDWTLCAPPSPGLLN